MSALDLRALISKLNPYTRKTVEAALGVCVSRNHYEVLIEHYLAQCLDDDNSDITLLLRHYDVDLSTFKRGITHILEKQKSENRSQPVFSRLFVELLQEAWLMASVEKTATQLRGAAIFAALVLNADRYAPDAYYDILKQIPVDDLRRHYLDYVGASKEGGGAVRGESGAPMPEGGGAAMQQFAINFTQQARDGKIDPVFGREVEIRQMIDILSRRRKNNPIVVGEAGVGKTAVVEGLALKIVNGDVPEVLRNVEIYGLDIGLLQAGASVKGAFEERLKAFIDEVKSSAVPVITFIDEAHTLIGAGGPSGGSDAANLLKPALARGELRTIAATTWSEYKKYFEKDAALARRFQVVRVEEPDIDGATLIMRGLRANYEKAHGVYVRDDAVVATAELAARYISGRQLPDKSVDLLDTACARVKISISARPEQLDDLYKEKEALLREINALKRDTENDQQVSTSSLNSAQEQLATIDDGIASLEDRWQKEKAQVSEIINLRQQISALQKTPVADSNQKGEASTQTEVAQTSSSDQRDVQQLRKALVEKEAALRQLQGQHPLIHYQVTPAVVERVVSDWTGIPVGNMVQDEAKAILELDARLQQRIKGQDHALARIAEAIRASKSGLANPKTPIGVFLLVGPSGVGKTETGLAIAEQLFGGERFTVSVNMSEFQEKHTVSRLIGSPPGYVGYGEGGVLTEAVRQRPYSVVLLDEVEKADPEVMNLFYQVFDKGVLSDGEGRVIDFKNTIILLTSNLATDEIMEMTDPELPPPYETVMENIRPTLSKHFKPALLARMDVIPYFPIGRDAMRDIVAIKLNVLKKRLQNTRQIKLDYHDRVLDQIVQRCTEVDTGARNIDYIVNHNLMPRISTQILQQFAGGGSVSRLQIDVDKKGDFSLSFLDESKPGKRKSQKKKEAAPELA
ncbi:MAG: type VI secretion system ATPase TssH [Gammaproteobacteria bacterium]|nr:type VI secretion system ATPase TssH [Gammaproteobacteria bacterium]